MIENKLRDNLCLKEMGYKCGLLEPGRHNDGIFLPGCVVVQWVLEVSRIQSDALEYWNNDKLPEIQIYASDKVYVHEPCWTESVQNLLASRQGHRNHGADSKKWEPLCETSAVDGRTQLPM